LERTNKQTNKRYFLCFQVLYQLADVNELLEERHKAMEWFIQLLSVVPTDAGVLRRLGQLCDAGGDQTQALHYFSDAHRYDPNNVTVVEWLGRYYIECQLAEKVEITSFHHDYVAWYRVPSFDTLMHNAKVGLGSRLPGCSSFC